MDDVNLLREIGKKLRCVMPSFIAETRGSSSLGIGASGDNTYPLDKKAEEIIIGGIEKSSKPATIISEEYGRYDIRGGGITFLIDPVDGSRNANAGLPFFATSIAVIDGDELSSTTVGYTLNLVTGDEYWAIKNKGCWLNGRPIRTQRDDYIHLIAFDAQDQKRDISRILPLLSMAERSRCIGSTALETAMVAGGVFSIFVLPFLSRTFDFAAGWLMIKEAGGVITDIEGNELDGLTIGLEKSNNILASGNDRLHKKALNALNI